MYSHIINITEMKFKKNTVDSYDTDCVSTFKDGRIRILVHISSSLLVQSIIEILMILVQLIFVLITKLRPLQI